MEHDEAYAVIITAIDPQRKIVAIKRIREITGLGLADAKSVVENLPSVIMDGLFAPQAAELCDLLTSVRMRVERRVDSAHPPTLKNLKQMSFDDTGDVGEINIPIEGGGSSPLVSAAMTTKTPNHAMERTADRRTHHFLR